MCFYLFNREIRFILIFYQKVTVSYMHDDKYLLELINEIFWDT